MNTFSIEVINEAKRDKINALLDDFRQIKLEPSNESEPSRCAPKIILTDFSSNNIDHIKNSEQYVKNKLFEDKSETNNNDQGTDFSSIHYCANECVRKDSRKRNVNNNNSEGHNFLSIPELYYSEKSVSKSNICDCYRSEARPPRSYSMVSIMDVKSDRQACDNRVIVSQSAVSQKSIDLDISLRPIISPTEDRDTGSLASNNPNTNVKQSQQPCSSSVSSIATGSDSYNHDITDTDLAKKSMKLNLVSSSNNNKFAESSIHHGSIKAESSDTSAGASTSSVVTTTTAIIMKHRKLKDRSLSDEIGSPKSPAATTGMGITDCALMYAPTISPSIQLEVVDDRKALRDALYQGIFHRHRRTIFAVGSFLRMLKSRNSSYNTIRSSSEGEDDTK